MDAAPDNVVDAAPDAMPDAAPDATSDTPPAPAATPRLFRGARIAWVATAAAAAASVFLTQGFTIHTVCLAVLCVLLVVAASHDAATFRIPNAVVAAVLVLWLAWAAILALVDHFPVPYILGQAALGALAAAAPAATLTALTRARSATPAFGMGDIKLLFAAGAFFTWQTNLIALAPACLIAAVIGIVLRVCRNERRLPFGCGIAAGWWLVTLTGLWW